jgi:hypothetical protein
MLRAIVSGNPAQQLAKCGMAARASGENYFTCRIATGSPNVSSHASKGLGIKSLANPGPVPEPRRSTARELEQARIFIQTTSFARLARMRQTGAQLQRDGIKNQ